MLYELRTYYIFPGRMEAIHRRFADRTLGIFSRLGMKLVDFWEDADNPVLYYLLEHADKAAAERSWAAFKTDPEWLEVKRASETDGPLVERIESLFLKRVPYSPVR